MCVIMSYLNFRAVVPSFFFVPASVCTLINYADSK